MVATASSTDPITNLSSQYKPRVTKEDPMGKDAFMKMLIAQLKNQDPLNPSDSKDMTAQLAQFTQLEKSTNMETTLTQMLATMKSQGQGNYVDHIGKTVTGNLSSMTVASGTADDGYFTLKKSAEAVVAIYDSKGAEVKRLFLGQQDAGTNSFKWDGKDTNDKAVADGSYSYDVYVVGPEGYSKVDSSVQGQVTGITNKNGKQYLEVSVNGSSKKVIVDPLTISAVTTGSTSSDKTNTSDYVNHIGKTVTGSTGNVDVASGTPTKGYFTLDSNQSQVLVSVLNSKGAEVNRIDLGSQSSGVHEIGWNGKDSSGNVVANGSYTYEILVKDSSGYSRINPVLTGKVTGVNYKDGNPYLEVSAGGAGSIMMDPATVQQIKES